MQRLKDLVIVAGHAALRAELSEPPQAPESDRAWALDSFQVGEVPFYLEHIRRGAVLLAHNPAALLLFSGGRTRQAAGRWSEARSYHGVARRAGWWLPPNDQGELRSELDRRSATEEYARDSFENLLFSWCRFQQLTGRYPRNTTVVSWAFKSTRFELHRRALRHPATCFRFVGQGDPFDLAAAQRGELTALRAFSLDPYGKGPELSQKRVLRNPFALEHPYATCPGLGDFFAFLAGSKSSFEGKLPWED
jgi:hypothetical protein